MSVLTTQINHKKTHAKTGIFKTKKQKQKQYTKLNMENVMTCL